MRGQFRSILQTATHTVTAHTRRTIAVTKLSVVSIGLITASLVPMVAFTGTAHADTDCSPNGVALSGSSWLSRGGVNVCNHPGDGSHYCLQISGDPVGQNCGSGYVWSGDKWECVEMINRLYLTKHWTTATWKGNGGGTDGLIYHLPGNLTDQLNGSISYINTGDVITLNYGTFGHAGIINSVSGTTYNIINQNADLNSSAYIYSGSLSSGNANLHMNAWLGYTVQAIVHHPTSPPPPAPNDDYPTPAVMDFNSKEQAFGRGTDNGLYVNAWQSGSGWSGFSNMQTNSVFASNPAAINFNGEGDVFARGTDKQIYKSTWNGTAWGGFSTLQSTATFDSDPVAYQYDNSNLNVFAVGTDGQMWEISKDPSWETAFSLLQTASYFVGKPAVIRYNDSEYVVGRGIDNEMYVDVWTSGTGWSGFTRIAPGSTFASDPAVFVFNNVLNIFARGTDNQMYANYFDTSWHPFSLIQSGALFSSNPTVAQFGGKEYVFARGTDNQIYGNAWTVGTGWSGFSLLASGTFVGNPVAIQYGTVLNVFAIGTDKQMYVNYYDTSWHSFSLIQSGALFYSSSW